ncbi:DUF6625 family protein [Rubrivirga sp.]|uniref:DUF6625 family protein n=1 Tax=Rubrivirga sp. TaxID=1885344 RepID=UPI003C75AE4A
MTPRIGLLTVFVGDLPDYVGLFLLSCGANPLFDVHVVSNREPPLALPSNVYWHRETLDRFNERAQATLDLPVNVQKPYKLCDFKPTFGTVYRDLLGRYEFWGYCDVDMVWGNVSHFLDDTILDGVDVYSVAGPGFLSGAFTLFRNTGPSARLFERSPNYERVLLSSDFHAFDEVCYRWGGPSDVSVLAKEGQPVSLTDVAHRAHEEGVLRLRTPRVLAEPSFSWDHRFRLTWDGERLVWTRSDQEVILCHFVHNKVEPFFTFPSWNRYPDHYTVSWAGLRASGDPDRSSVRVVLDDMPRALAWGGSRVLSKIRHWVPQLRDGLR